MGMDTKDGGGEWSSKNQKKGVSVRAGERTKRMGGQNVAKATVEKRETAWKDVESKEGDCERKEYGSL